MAILILDEFFNEKPYSYTQQLERFNEANKQLLERNSRLTASNKMYRKRIKEFSTKW